MILIVQSCYATTTISNTIESAENESCLGPAWLCTQLAQMQETMAAQANVITEQQAMLAKQDTVINEMQDKLVLQNQEIQHLCQLRYGTDRRSDLEFSLTKRADDTNTLEVVVSQMSQRLDAATADLQALKNSHTQLDQSVQAASTSTYVRWGRSQCSDTAQLIYTGWVGGSSSTHTGGAMNYLCLTKDPVASTLHAPSTTFR
jgi:regulator of replication initiation timing